MSHDLDALTSQHRDLGPDLTTRGGRRSRDRSPLVTGVVVAVVAAVAGLFLAISHETTWSTHREVVVVPRADTGLDQAASLFDSLSRGQVVATAAEIYGQTRWHADAPGVTVTAGAVPPSAVIKITATGSDEAQVQATLEHVITAATDEVNSTLTPYRTVPLGDHASPPQVVGPSRAVLAAVAILGAVLAGVLAAGVVTRLRRPRQA